MSTPAKMAFGVFLTLMTLCQVGVFDPQFNGYFERDALTDKDWFTRLLFPLVWPQNFISDIRDEDPLGFASMAMLPSAFFALATYIFMSGLRAIVKSGENSSTIAEEHGPA